MSPQHTIRKSLSKRQLRRGRFQRRKEGSCLTRLLVEVLEPRVVLASGAIGDQFLVAETFGFESGPPAVTVQVDGSFIAAWESFEEDGNGFGIFAQRFTAEGAPSSLERFQVNTTSEGDQSAPVLASDSAGNALIVWQSKDQDGSGYGIYGQWYDNLGVAIGTEFQINETTAGDQWAPSLAMDGSGKAIVAWQSDGQDGDATGIYYTILESPGDQSGTEHRVNDSTVGAQQSPSVAVAANGNFVIAWEAIDPAGGEEASLDIYAKVFDSSGAVIIGELKVNTESLHDQVGPEVAIDAVGNFVVVWVSEGIPGSGSDVFGQRFNSAGVAAGAEFRVNDTTLASQRGADVSMDDAGRYLVTWQSVHQDGFSWGVFGRKYDSDGDTLKSEFVVNTQVEGPQTSPSVTTVGNGQTIVAWLGKNETHQPAVFAQRYALASADPDFAIGTELQLGTFIELEGNAPAAAMDGTGSTVVAWESYSEDGSGFGVYAQILDSFGDPMGPKFLVNAAQTIGNQLAPAVARAADGRFVIAWQSETANSGFHGIYAQIYNADGSPLEGSTTIEVESALSLDQSAPAVAIAEDGRFVIVWQGMTADGTTDIFAQRYDQFGGTVGAEFQVNHFESRDQIMPAVAMNAAGEFAIAWVSSHPAETIPELDPEKSVFVQWYDANGVADGFEVLAHNHVKDAQESPSIGIDAAGHFVVAWQSINQDGSTWGVYARQFRNDKSAVQEDEFLVNETIDGLQRLVGVGVRSDGHFVITWESTTEGTGDGSGSDIYRREYLPDGTPDGGETLVNTWTEGPQTMPVVAQATTGNYGVFWAGQGLGHVDGVHGRLYDINFVDDPGEPSRLPIGDQFFVAETFGFENSAPAIAVHGDGGFTVAFETFEEDGNGYGIFTARLNADGTPIPGSRMQVNSSSEGDQSAPAIASDAAGNVLIVWQSNDEDGDGYGIFGQWISSAGALQGSQFQLNTTTIGDQSLPAVAMDDAGRAVVAWQSDGQDGDGWGIYYVRLDFVGDTNGVEMRANEITVVDQQAVTVAAASATGAFLIAWQGPGPAIEEAEASIEIFARLFDETGAAVDSEFQVNTEASHDQVSPDAAMDADGDAVVVWQAEGQQGSGSDIYVQRIDASGALLSTDLLVNSTTTRPQRGPAVSIDQNGTFLVTWQSSHQDGFSWGIFGHQYDQEGGTLVDEFQINSRVQGPQTSVSVDTNDNGQTIVAWLGNDASHRPAVFGQRYQIPNADPAFKVGGELNLTNFLGIEESPPAAAMNANRESVVVWQSYAEDGSGLGIFGQLLNSSGEPMGVKFAVNRETFGNQGAPAVARAPDGRFVIAWQSEDQDGDGYGIYARMYAEDGSPLGSDEFRVNATTLLDQTTPAVAMAPDGQFIIIWQSVTNDGSLDIMAQRYFANGEQNGSEFRINYFTGLDQKDPAIAMNAAGEFVVAWVSDHPALTDPDDTEKSIFVQWFNSDGQSSGNEVLVHRYVKDAQEAPAVGIDASGRFVVAWQSINQDGNTWGVFARTFNKDKTPVERREYVVNETRLGPQRYVGVGMDEIGRFVITWQSNSHEQEGSSWDVYSRQYGFDGRREGGELPVNQWNMGPQILPVVAQTAGGDFGIFWIGQGPDHVEGVHGRIYANNNQSPVADAGGPYEIIEFASLDLDGSKSYDPDATGLLSYSWDLNGDGVYGDAVGATPTLRWEELVEVGITQHGIYSVSLQVSDALGNADHSVTTLTVTVATPAVDISGPVEAVRGQTRSFVLSTSSTTATDVLYEIDWNGDGVVDETVTGPAVTTVTHVYVSEGTYSMSVAATANGVTSAWETQVINVTRYALQPDDVDPLKHNLVVGGTTGDDLITVLGMGPNLLVTSFGFDGENLVFTPASYVTWMAGVSGRVIIFGQGGDDLISTQLVYGVSANLYGGDGNDILVSGYGDDLLFGDAGDDLLLGGMGNDTLDGSSGNDVLIGGFGADRLWGGSDDDLLIAGSGTFERNSGASFDIHREWVSARSYPDRTANLSGHGSGPRANGNTFIQGGSIVFNDSAVDVVFGEEGQDWVFLDVTEDLHADLEADELVVDLG